MKTNLQVYFIQMLTAAVLNLWVAAPRGLISNILYIKDLHYSS